MLVRSSRVLLISVLVLVVALVAPRGKVGATTTPPLVGPKAYYLALGDSLAFGYQPQPDGDWSHGYADDFYKDLKGHVTTSLVNMACIGETSTTFITTINGPCPYWYLRKTFYTGSQLNAAVSFITSKSHKGQVSPVTLDIGGNDMLPLVNSSNCAVSNWSTTLSTFNENFTNILRTLAKALNGQGDLLVNNYYDPYEILCPGTVTYLDPIVEDSFDWYIAKDANTCTYYKDNDNLHLYPIPCNVHVVDVFTPFSGNICTYTWMCSSSHPNDIHPTTTGYGAIARAYETTAGY